MFDNSWNPDVNESSLASKHHPPSLLWNLSKSAHWQGTCLICTKFFSFDRCTDLGTSHAQFICVLKQVTAKNLFWHQQVLSMEIGQRVKWQMNRTWSGIVWQVSRGTFAAHSLSSSRTCFHSCEHNEGNSNHRKLLLPLLISRIWGIS